MLLWLPFASRFLSAEADLALASLVRRRVKMSKFISRSAPADCPLLLPHSLNIQHSTYLIFNSLLASNSQPCRSRYNLRYTPVTRTDRFFSLLGSCSPRRTKHWPLTTSPSPFRVCVTTANRLNLSRIKKAAAELLQGRKNTTTPAHNGRNTF